MTHEEKVQEVMDALVAEAGWPADGLSLVTQQDVLLCDGAWMTKKPDGCVANFCDPAGRGRSMIGVCIKHMATRQRIVLRCFDLGKAWKSRSLGMGSMGSPPKRFGSSPGRLRRTST